MTGTHLSPAFGETWKEIEKDGVRIDCKIDYLSDDRSPEGIAREAGHCAQLFSSALSQMQPDLLLVLGDRYELLPICSSALLMGIPIAHKKIEYDAVDELQRVCGGNRQFPQKTK